jgi:ribonucleoside-triphosphate reductase
VITGKSNSNKNKNNSENKIDKSYKSLFNDNTTGRNPMFIRPDIFNNSTPKWGFMSGPNSLGELVYRRTYRREEETWADTVSRCVNGTFDILQNHCKHYNLPFDHTLALKEAGEMARLIYNFKFTPPGRGLWVHGTPIVDKVGSMPLMNCAFVSTANIAEDREKPFCFLMDVSMLGVGCGFDTDGAGKTTWTPTTSSQAFLIPDSREGWVEALGKLLLWGFGLYPKPLFDYSLIRPKGTPIRGFGGVAEGPEPLKSLLKDIETLILLSAGKTISVRNIVDIMNLVGRCVVAGNIRRTAEISFGSPDDPEYLDLKDYSKNPERASYGWTSNNSVYARLGMDYSAIAERTRINGEPGYFWLQNAQQWGRIQGTPDNKDYRVKGSNPCVEQLLEPYEVCNLNETYLPHHKTLPEFLNTLKYAFLYSKAITLLPTHWSETNAVQLRNRRIGTSLSGVAQFLAYNSKKTLIDWCEAGYETVSTYDRIYSEWLGVRESIRKTSIKPSGTVSLLAGCTPGCHYPLRNCYIRRVRYSTHLADLKAIKEAGYKTELMKMGDREDPHTTVVEFPVMGDVRVATVEHISAREQLELAVLLQKHWADNSVSVTVTFDPVTEGPNLNALLKEFESQLKAVSFLPALEEGAYPQMPYESITPEQYLEMTKDLKPIQWPEQKSHDMNDVGCDGIACEITAQKEELKV